MHEIHASLAGNLTRDPELRSTANGQAVASLSIAVTPRRYDANTQQWRDGTTSYIDVSAWGQLAENVAKSLRQGDRALVQGRWVTRAFTPQSGPNAGSEVRRLEVVADEIGPGLRWATARPTKVTGRPNLHSMPDDEPPL
jgi:single-strand DNA-binding protein